MNEPSQSHCILYFEPVASSFYDGATGNRCFKLETITSSRIGGESRTECIAAFLRSYLQSWKARLDYRVHSCARDNKPLPLIRKHGARAVRATGMSLIFHFPLLVFVPSGSSYVNEPHRWKSVVLGVSRRF